MKRTALLVPLLLGIAIAGFPPLLQGAQVYNLVEQFDSSHNPSSSGWSYGSMASSSGSFTLLTYAGWNFYDTGYMGWTVSAAAHFPEVNRNSVGVEYCPLAAPGLCGVRWSGTNYGTATVNATLTGYWLASADTGYNYTIAGGYVFTNGVSNFEGDINNSSGFSTVTYQRTIVVKPGDTIDIMVGPNSSGVVNWARTRVSATISFVPTPTVTLTSSSNPSAYGGNVTLTVTVSPSDASGTVTFKDGATTLGTGSLSGGIATLATNGLTVGNHSLTAEYAGDSSYTASTSSPLSQTVNQAGTTNVVDSSSNPSLPGANVTFTATVGAVAPGSGIPTNQVCFLTNGIPAATNYLDATGLATYSTALLPHGSNTVTAQYVSDGNFLPSTNRIAQVVNTPPTASGFTMGGKRGEPATVAVIGGKHPPADVDVGDAATLHLTAVTQGSHGIVSTDSTNVTYTGTGGDSGTDSFTYTVSDRYGGTAVATVTVRLAGSDQGFNLVSATPIDGGQMRLTYLGVPGYGYALDRTDNLAYPIQWIPQATNLTDGVGQLIFTNQADAATNNFWRTRYLP